METSGMTYSKVEIERNKLPLPESGKRNIMITSSLPYVNNVPHLGNIIGSLLSADVYARYCKQRGYNTIYICGTDEYGTATETKAMEERTTPIEVCNKYYKIHKQVYDFFDIEFDHFGRTSTEYQTKIAQDIFLKLYNNNYLVEKTLEQLYDPVLNKFLADRFVYGVCPRCGYEDAGGDQCDQCGALYHATELINPKSRLSDAVPELRPTNHLYLDLPKLQDAVETWFSKAHTTGHWTQIATTITQSWFKAGLAERCITRDLRWGTPVPLEKYKDKVFYVWFDAPIGYISITAAASDNWEKWWKNPENVEYVEFMGKDNVPFHAVIFPASLIGTGEKWTLVNSLSSTEYLNYEDGKFSKRKGIGVFGDQAQETGIPCEVWRYYLLTNRPESSDTVFSWEDFQSKLNNELLANLGNFVNRTLKFIHDEKNFNAVVPEGGDISDADRETINEINKHITEYINSFESIRLKDGLHLSMGISKIGNAFLQANKPWELIKTDKARCGVVMNIAVQIVRLLTSLLEPYMPAFSRKVLKQLNITLDGPNTIEDSFNLQAVPAGHKIGTPEVLFTKLDNERTNELKARYSGGEKFILDLRIGEIVSVEEHPDPTASKLYKMQVRVGREEKKQILGALREVYPDKNALKGKKVIVVCNLKHNKLRGEKSEGMLLVGKSSTGEMALLTPQQDMEPGISVKPKGTKLDLEKVVAPKTLQAVVKHLNIGNGGLACYKDYPFVAGVNEIFIKPENEQIGPGSQVF
jgi:methionyl-tRNA synthetase